MRTQIAMMLSVVGLAATAAAQDRPQAPASVPTAIAVHVKKPAVQWGPCPPVFAPGCEVAVLHGDPGKPGADVWLRVPGGYAIAPHSHTSAERMTLVSGRLKVRYEGQAATVLEAGDYAYGPAKAPHVALCLGRTPCTLYIAFQEPVDATAFSGELALR
jgi:quercetin dioxygenase-like cupin family protein